MNDRLYGWTLFFGVPCALRLNAKRAALLLTKTPLFPCSQEYHQPTILNNSSSTIVQPAKSGRKMSQYTIDNSTFSNNTNSFNVQNYYAAEDRSQLLTWLSPVEPRLCHRDIQEHRVDNVGEWLLQTEKFRSWYDRGGEGEGDKAVLFCYGGPGVGRHLSGT